MYIKPAMHTDTQDHMYVQMYTQVHTPTCMVLNSSTTEL